MPAAGDRTAAALASALCLDDLAQAAAAVLPPEVWDFLAGGSGGERTLKANRAALDRVRLIPRILNDVSACSTGADLLGRPADLPLAIAPVAYQRLFHPDGELATARAAKTAGVPFTVSTVSSTAVEDIAAVGGRVWFQLYWQRDRARNLELVRRAEQAGCEAVMLTVDCPWMGRRLADMRNRFALPADVRAANLTATPAAHRRTRHASAVAADVALTHSAALTWADVELLRAHTGLPLLLKGVLDPVDARRAADSGVTAIVVSNHGGRQLDGAVSSIEMLADIAGAVGGGCEVLFDSGVRGGLDVVRALALGASGVLLGRPAMWGLAAGGEAGVRRALDLVAAELRDTLGLAGCDRVPAARSLGVRAAGGQCCPCFRPS
jgi:4-hydroxymandelate oxidase